MAGSFAKALVVLSIAAAGGCAPWKSEPAANYVTVESDPRHDTAEARKHYHAARKQMLKYACDKKCDLEKAEKSLQEALTVDVRFGPAHHSLGVLYFWQQKLYLAAWEFEYAARLMPDRFEPLNNLGLVYEAAGKHEQATSYYLLAREKSHNNPEVIGNLARASYRMGQSVDEMQPLLEDVIATSTRPEFRRWAEELLGLNGKPLDGKRLTPSVSADIPSVKSEPFPMPTGQESLEVEELPLIPPPAPTTEPTSSTSSSALELHSSPDRLSDPLFDAAF